MKWRQLDHGIGQGCCHQEAGYGWVFRAEVFLMLQGNSYGTGKDDKYVRERTTTGAEEEKKKKNII